MQSRRALVVVGTLFALIGSGVAIDELDWFAPLRAVVRDRTVDREALDRGALGEILLSEGLVYPTNSAEDGRWRRRQVRPVYRADPTRRPVEPVAPPADALAHGWPVVAVSIDEDRLYDDERGLFVNWEERWEAPAHVAYFEDGEQLFETGCGLRLHGGTSRKAYVQEERGVTWRSVRLYFREGYGLDQAPDGVFFGPEYDPIDRLVVRGDSAISSALSFDISRRLGATAPPMRPGLYVLNGEIQGLFSMTLHLTRSVWEEVLGHEDFAFYRMRGGAVPEDEAAFHELEDWVASLAPGEFTWEGIDARVDLDHLIRHLFTIAWCGTDDWAQGAAVLDRSEDEPRWRWVHWDMDRSFRYSLTVLEDQEPWQKHGIDLLLGRGEVEEGLLRERDFQLDGVRGRLFAGLVRDSEVFRQRFAAFASEAINHRLSRDFFVDRLEYYSTYTTASGIGRSERQRVVQFFRRRSPFLQAELARAFGLDGPFALTLVVPVGLEVQVDGQAVPPDWSGSYLAGQEVVLDARGGVKGTWQVDGRVVGEGRSVSVPMTRDLELRWVE